MKSDQRHDLAKLTAAVLVVTVSVMVAPLAAMAGMIGFIAGRELQSLPDPVPLAGKDEEE